MNKLRLATAAALVCGLFAGSASAASVESTNDWWSVDFQSPTATGVALVEGQLGALTNDARYAEVVQPYNSGVWTALEGDESVITNGIVTNAVANTSATSTYLKLDTQGNDLTWTPTNTTRDVEISKALVDADLLLVGSDSAPATDDFDKNGDVQTAIYLKNEIDEDNGETTNSVLCAYVYDTDLTKSVWVELKNAANPELTDNSWHHIAVFVEYPAAGNPQVSVEVDGTLMKDATGKDQWPVANVEQNYKKLTSVSLRGTGAVDNFTGKAITSTDTPYNFAADVYLDGTFQPEMSVTNYTAAATVLFGDKNAEGFFMFDNATGPGNATYALSSIRVYNPGTDSWTTYNYTYDKVNNEITPETETDFIVFELDENDYQTGEFSVTASTDGATEDCTLVEIHYLTIGAHNANAVTVVGGTSTTEPTVVKPSDFAEGATKTITWTFNATEGANVLRTVAVQNGATATYANGVATVTVTLSEMIAADTTYVTATYVEGDYTGKTPQWIDNGDGSYTLATGVAKIGTTIYETLASAIAAVEADAATTTTVTLISSVNEDVVIPAGKNVELDLFGNAITNVASDTISVYGTLLLKDSSENTNGIVASAIANKAALVNYPTGSVTIEAGTIAVSDNATYYNIKNMGAMTIKEGAVIVSRVSTKSTLIANGWYGNAAVDRDTTGQPNTAILTINGGVFDGGLNVVKNDDYGILVIEGGTFSNLSQTDAVILNWNETTINGGEFTGVTKILCNGSYGANSADKGVMTINGGTFRANGEQGNLFGYGTQGGKMSDALLEITGGTFYGHVAGLGDNDGTLGVAAISGGSFSEVVPQIYCAEGYVPVTTVDPTTGLYTVGKGAVQITIAEVVKTFGSIADAQAAAATAEIADPVFTIIDTLSEETVTLAYEDTLKIVVAEDGDATALSVETSEVDNSQYTYAVVSNTDTETGVTTYSVTRTVKTYAVTFTVDGTTVATTNAPYGDTLYGPADPTKTAETGYTVAFAGWTNAVAGGAVVAAADLPAVTGEATWAAVFTTTAIEYTVTVALDGGSLAEGVVIPATYTVETAAFPLPTPTKEGFTFKGWVDGDNQPVTQIAGGATGDISLTATWEEDSVEVKVNPGDGLAQYKTDHPDATVPEPIEFTSDATPLCKIAFVAPATGKYVLMTSTTVNGTYQAEGTPTAYEAGALVELTETASATTKFFKIGYEK